MVVAKGEPKVAKGKPKRRVCVAMRVLNIYCFGRAGVINFILRAKRRASAIIKKHY